MKLTLIAPKIYHLLFDTQEEMCSSLMRFEEFYESPKFAGKVFSREEFQNWYAKEYGKFTYFSDWDGFNIPGSVFEHFHHGEFNPLTNQELDVLRVVNPIMVHGPHQHKHNHTYDFYVIGTCSTSHPFTYKHELGHAYYATDWQYRWLARLCLVFLGWKIIPIIKYLLKTKYSWKVVIDETHAWLLDGAGILKEEKVPFSPFVIKLLNKLYNWKNK